MSQENDFVPQQKDYKKLRPFPLFMKNNFPFIENTFEAIDYYGLLCEVVKFLNDVIENENIVTENQKAVYDAFIELNTYVSNYFDNLDVQEEINNKLDEMVEDGTFENILLNYTQITKVYNTTIDMINDTSEIAVGQKLKTLGYYTINDGGSCEFYVSNDSNSNYLIEKNNLFLIPIIYDDKLNVKSVGAKGDKIQNDTNYFEKAISILENRNGGTLYIPTGEYIINQIAIKNSINIMGESAYLTKLYSSNTNINGKFIYLASAPAQNIEIKNFSIYNETTSNIETGLHIEAFERETPPLTGGFWHSKITNLFISGFKRGLFTEAIDVVGDVANQFLIFEKIRIYRNGLSNDELCAELNGQLGQTKFVECQFQSSNQGGATWNLAPGKNIKVGGTVNPTLLEFNMCTFQNSEIGIEITSNIASINNCWFENLGQAIIAGNTSKVFVENNNFANAGGNSENTGFIIQGNASSYISLKNNRIVGRVDKLINAGSARFIEQSGNGVDYPTSGLLRQVSIGENNTLTTYGNSFFLLNIGDNTQLDTINANQSTLDEITILATGSGGKSLLVTSSGNIQTPNSQNLTLHTRDCIKLKKGDTVNKWIITSVAKKPMVSATSPETAFSGARFLTGEIVYNSNPSSNNRIGWICTSAGTPRNMENFWAN